ncbi:ribosome biogenesis protein Nop16 [Ancylostoma caninum]|uniref:Nucleolar protein 16 n=1 Tax=Ancylostoma caninum TaxID=29170 RepID=A0A368EZL1_ANCCA|nr:ribosome biogenesis protein Nop16 [Ancylostoma caninum]RCN30138.1 ribosome biogenesis protein Nop16 [Ancylostoma caninum]
MGRQSISNVQVLVIFFELFLNSMTVGLEFAGTAVERILGYECCHRSVGVLFFRKVIKENWETSRTPRENVLAMGLAFSPNEAVPVKQPHRDIIDMVAVEEMDLTEARVLGTVAEQRLKKQQEKRAVLKKEKALKVVSSLEREANEIQADRDSQPRAVRLPDRDVELLIYLAQRYGDDYKAMARDPKNLFQYTPKKISNLMKIYRSSGFCQVIESVS